MSFLSSLKHNPTETRRTLRARFARHLPSDNPAHSPVAKDVTLSDELLLQLLQSLTIDFESDLENANASYSADVSPSSAQPTLDQLIADGWIHVVWGRTSTSFELAEAARAAASGELSALVAFLGRRYGQKYRVSGSQRGGGSLSHVIAAIENETLDPQNIGCQTPGWVASRLWDRTLTSFSKNTVALRTWLDRWQLLHCPALVPGRTWAAAEAQAFREAAFHVIESEANLVGWEGMRVEIRKQMALLNQQPSAGVEERFTTIPRTLVGRALWLTDYPVLHISDGRMSAHFGDFVGLVSLLLADVEAEDHAPAPHKVAAHLFSLAVDRPDLLFILLFIATRNSSTFADLLLHPKTSALACLLIAQWRSPTSAWDRELVDHDNELSQSIAFSDAAAVLGHFLKEKLLDAAEVAALLNWFHETAPIGFVDDATNSESMLTALRNELVGQSPEILEEMVAHLLNLGTPPRLGTANFAAALDIIDAGKLTERIESSPLVEAYAQSIQAGGYGLTARRVSCGAAVSLFRLASSSPVELRDRFLRPLNSKQRLDAATADDLFSVSRDIARSVRVHIRLLSRAVVGWIGDVPDILITALVDAVRTGAMQHLEKRRVAAFSASYEANVVNTPHDRPIAADVGEALSALDENDGQELLAAVLEIDEPMVLAQLLAFAPFTMRESIKSRVAQLTPADAGDTYSLSEAQARIEALLSADLPDAAALFIEHEEELKTWGRVPGRELTRLRAALRLKLVREEWDAIATTEPPSDLPQVEHQAALETIRFYMALADLKNPNGNRHAAAQRLAELNSRHPDVASYALNLFAAHIILLFDRNMFQQLRDAALVRGNQILTQSEEIPLHATALSEYEAEFFYSNKALLLLALNRAREASQLLASLPVRHLHDTVAAYSAVALARLGKRLEAIATLNRAKDANGETEILQKASAHIQIGSPFAVTPSILLENDPIPRMKAAMLDFKRMDPIQQAEVLMPIPNKASFEAFAIKEIRSAAASVTSLVPMMRNVKVDSCEDDLNALVRELLTSRLSILDWSVSDQSKGGFTAKENPGERDLIIKKDSTTLSVIEAVVCRHTLSPTNLEHHLRRLLAYSSCRLFFHLTYSYIQNPGSIIESLRQIAAKNISEDFRFLDIEEIAHTDSRPLGFIAQYAGEFGPVKVVFLVLDMSQHVQRRVVTAPSNPPKGASRESASIDPTAESSDGHPNPS